MDQYTSRAAAAALHPFRTEPSFCGGFQPLYGTHFAPRRKPPPFCPSWKSPVFRYPEYKYTHCPYPRCLHSNPGSHTFCPSSCPEGCKNHPRSQQPSLHHFQAHSRHRKLRPRFVAVLRFPDNTYGIQEPEPLPQTSPVPSSPYMADGTGHPADRIRTQSPHPQSSPELHFRPHRAAPLPEAPPVLLPHNHPTQTDCNPGTGEFLSPPPVFSLFPMYSIPQTGFSRRPPEAPPCLPYSSDTPHSPRKLHPQPVCSLQNESSFLR